jgi:carotenoid cleavage oxygenase
MRNRYLEGNFGPVAHEYTSTDLAVRGTIPSYLDSRYLRNGPNPIGELDPATYHWFMGAGMVHGVRLASPLVWSPHSPLKSHLVGRAMRALTAGDLRHRLGW